MFAGQLQSVHVVQTKPMFPEMMERQRPGTRTPTLPDLVVVRTGHGGRKTAEGWITTGPGNFPAPQSPVVLIQRKQFPCRYQAIHGPDCSRRLAVLRFTEPSYASLALSSS
jgi:hypothetical protein